MGYRWFDLAAKEHSFLWAKRVRNKKNIDVDHDLWDAGDDDVFTCG